MSSVDASEAQARLKAGNERFRQDRDERPHNSAEYRRSLSGGQKPIASIVTCADSRVPPELVFDQGLGDLFVLRVAGNIVDDAILGSLEYAAMHLGVKLIVVMGHAKCGAAQAAVENVDVDGPATNTHIDCLIDSIRPAVKAALGADDVLDASIRRNASMMAGQIRDSEPVMTRLAGEGVEVVSAYYDLDSGEVEWLG